VFDYLNMYCQPPFDGIFRALNFQCSP
jgi:hypothetical protein